MSQVHSTFKGLDLPLFKAFQGFLKPFKGILTRAVVEAGACNDSALTEDEAARLRWQKVVH
jgi:hypothetical protein